MKLFSFKSKNISVNLIKDKYLNKDRIYSKEQLQKILDRFYNCRDIEIANLWQRSFLLSGFILLSYTGYAAVSFTILTNERGKIIDIAENYKKIIDLNTICILILSIGLTLSFLHILMSKSSKAWFEFYEQAIYNIENDHGDVLDIPLNYRMGYITVPNEKFSKNIFSTKGGGFSPSKINIFIGQFSLILQLLFILFHLFYGGMESIEIKLLNIFIFLIAIVVCLYIRFSGIISSTALV